MLVGNRKQSLKLANLKSKKDILGRRELALHMFIDSLIYVSLSSLYKLLILVCSRSRDLRPIKTVYTILNIQLQLFLTGTWWMYRIHSCYGNKYNSVLRYKLNPS